MEYNHFKMMRERLKRKFYAQPTLTVARKLLGQRLVCLCDRRKRLAGLILETEAYIGVEDLACHAHVGWTQRNATMWKEAGHAYVYFTYGMHWMLNIVTESDGFPAAVLIRACWPVEGLTVMQQRRPVSSIQELTNGPAKICQAFGIDGVWNGLDLCATDSVLFVEEDRGLEKGVVTTGPREGLKTVPEPWKSKPWRFEIDPKRTHTKMDKMGKA